MTRGKLFRALAALAILACLSLSIDLPARNSLAAHAQEETPPGLQPEQAPFGGNPEGVDSSGWVPAASALAPDALRPIPGWMVESNQVYAQFGYSVASDGDVNGDGFDDVIVGASGYRSELEQADEGAAAVYYGSAGGLRTSSGWMVESNQVSTQFGYSVATAGDVNGDSGADVIIGVPLYD